MGRIILKHISVLFLDNASNEKGPHKPVRFGINSGANNSDKQRITFLNNTSNEEEPYKLVGFGMIWGRIRLKALQVLFWTTL